LPGEGRLKPGETCSELHLPGDPMSYRAVGTLLRSAVRLLPWSLYGDGLSRKAVWKEVDGIGKTVL